MERAKYIAVFLALIFSACAGGGRAPRIAHPAGRVEAAKVAPAKVLAPPASYVPREEEFELWQRLVAPVVRITAPHSGGSGVIIQGDGTILTASHVVTGGEPVRVALVRLQRDGTLTEFAWYDADVLRINRAHDFAVLRIRRPPRDLPMASLGRSSQLRPGDPLRRVGHGLVRLAVGTVIANNVPHRDLARTIEMRMTGGPGSSGGPVYDRENVVVGIAVASDRPNFNPSYAIPISVIWRDIF